MVWLIVTVPKFKAEGCWRHCSVLSSKSRSICACPSAQDSACANCHSGGVDALETFKDNVDVVTNGKGSMPASADKLSKKEIEEVAQYVMDQSEKGWWSRNMSMSNGSPQGAFKESGDTKRRKDKEPRRFRLGEAKASPSFTWSFQSRWVCAETASAQGVCEFSFSMTDWLV